MACRAGVADPFRKAQALLRELAGWSVDADTLRRRCHEQAARAAAGRADRAALPAAFAQAAGDRELHIDAGKVNTVEGGWRDVKVAALACRARLGPGEGLQAWLRQAKGLLVADGYAGACAALGSLTAVAGASPPACAAVAEALNYFCGHRDRLGYALRLRRGQSIGSGLVEGSIKQLVNLRLKRTGA